METLALGSALLRSRGRVARRGPFLFPLERSNRYESDLTQHLGIVRLVIHNLLCSDL
jgi:hypothetical protein